MQDFNNALNLCGREFSHNELLEFLQTGSELDRQYAALELREVNSFEEFLILLDNLVGVNGKIREAAALKVYDFTSRGLVFSEQDAGTVAKIFAQATVDINANVCRAVVDAASFLHKIEGFGKTYADELCKIIFAALEEIDPFARRVKQYAVNKQMFKLYWCLEAVFYYYEYIGEEKLTKILKPCSSLNEYTIREKCARILTLNLAGEAFGELRRRLAEDENYYVRNKF